MNEANPSAVNFPISARMVRELKGAPLACFTLLALESAPVSNEWLCMMSGYTDKPVAQALKLLSSAEYQLAKRSRGGWVLDENSKSRNNSVPTTTTLLINTDLNTQVVVATRKNSASMFEANLEACKSAHIGEPSASNLSDLLHVTPDFIKAHAESLQPGETTGLAITRIIGNEIPALWRKKSEVPAGKAVKPVSAKVAALRARADSEIEVEVE